MVDKRRDDDSTDSRPPADPIDGARPASPFTRTLSASERAWAGPNPSSWANLVRAIRLRRAVEPDAFRSAIAALQRELVELRCCLVAGKGKQPVLEERGAAIPVRIHDGAGDPEVMRHLTEELRTPVGCDGGPLMRAALFTADDAATIVLTVHHVIIDRNASKTLIERLLAALDGVEVAAKPGRDRVLHPVSLLGATRAAWSLLRERSLSAAGRRRPGLGAPLADTTHFTVVRLDAAASRAALAKSSEVGVRVTALMTAAAIWALDRLYPAAGAGARVGILMDLMSGERTAGLGSAVGMPAIDLQKTSEQTFADLARTFDTRIAELRASSAALDSASLFAVCGPLIGSLARRMPVRMGSLAVTNLGDLDLAEHTRSSGLFETFGIVTNQRAYFDIALQAQSLDGRMTVVFTSPVIDAVALEEFGRTWRSVLGVGST